MQLGEMVAAGGGLMISARKWGENRRERLGGGGCKRRKVHAMFSHTTRLALMRGSV